MFEIDMKLKHGFSRDLIGKVLMTPEMTERFGRERPPPEEGKEQLPGKLPLMETADYKKMLMDSGYRTKGKQMTSSLNPEQFMQLMEKVAEEKLYENEA